MERIRSLDTHLAREAFKRHGKSRVFDALAMFCARPLILFVGLLALASAPIPRLALASVAAWGVTVAVEYAVARKRPFKALGKEPLGAYWTPTPSFPSAHAAVAFAVAGTALAYDGAVGALLLGLAALVALARAYVGVHYASDILAGAVLGIGVSLLISM